MSMLSCYGQDRAISRLQRYRTAQRIPHGLIFGGPEGVGKHLLARQWAKLLLCGEPQIQNKGDSNTENWPGDLEQMTDACGQCDDCRLAESGNHPDLHLVDKTLIRHAKQGRDRQMIALPVDVIREFVIEPAGTAASRGRARVFIIDGAEQMNLATQNALLKTLEEPPRQTYLILITSQPDKLLATVRSRCQTVNLALLGVNYVEQALSEKGVAEPERRYWANFSQGRLGLALRLSELEMFGPKCELIEQVAKLGYENVLTLAAWMVEQAKEFALRVVATQKDLAQSSAVRQGQKLLLEMLSHGFNRALNYSAGSETSESSQGEQIERLAETFGPLGCAEAIWATFRAQTKLEANVNPALLFESLMIEYLDCRSRLGHCRPAI